MNRARRNALFVTAKVMSNERYVLGTLSSFFGIDILRPFDNHFSGISGRIIQNAYTRANKFEHIECVLRDCTSSTLFVRNCRLRLLASLKYLSRTEIVKWRNISLSDAGLLFFFVLFRSWCFIGLANIHFENEVPVSSTII